MIRIFTRASRAAVLVILVLKVYGQERRVSPILETQRVALVIGNSHYQNTSTLRSASSDAAKVAKELELDGFVVFSVLDTDQKQLATSFERFLDRTRPGDICLIYYSGHIFQVEGENFLVPIDAVGSQDDERFRYSGYSVNRVLDLLDRSGAVAKVVILDSPGGYFQSTRRGVATGVAPTDRSWPDTAILYSARPGQIANESAGDEISPFTKSLLEVLTKPGLDIQEAFEHVRVETSEQTQGAQIPLLFSTLTGRIILTPKASGTSSITPAEMELWNNARASDSLSDYETFLSRFPDGQFSTEARKRIELARARATPIRSPNEAVRPGSARLNLRDGLRYVWIPPGSFKMGCSSSDDDCRSDEKPSHLVDISHGYWMSQTEVSVAAYLRFTRATGAPLPPSPSVNPGWSFEMEPIVYVNWEEAKAFCEWAGGRLPTEAEWEYAARGGTETPRYAAPEVSGWFAENTLKLQNVGLKTANSFGLYDMLGNASEWTADWFAAEGYQRTKSIDPVGEPSGQTRVVRGGSWRQRSSFGRASSRYGFAPQVRNGDTGIRCAQPMSASGN